MVEKEKKTRSREEKPKIQVVDRRHWMHEEGPEEEEAGEAAPEERYPTYVEKLKQEAEEKDRKLREYIAAFKEKTAENEEFRMRLQRENENRLDQFKANLFARLLPVLDNLKRAAQAADSSKDMDSLKQGIQMVITQYARELQDQGVEIIQTRDRKFNPKTDEAFMTVPTDDPEMDNMILEELEPGYLYKEKLIKPAKVKVARLKES